MPHAAELDDAFERTVPGLPVVGHFNVEGVPGKLAFWERYSEQGLFGFDWKLWDGSYVRVTSPTVAVTVDDLPRVMRELALLVRLPLDFGTITEFKIHDLGIPIARKLDE